MCKYLFQDQKYTEYLVVMCCVWNSFFSECNPVRQKQKQTNKPEQARNSVGIFKKSFCYFYVNMVEILKQSTTQTNGVNCHVSSIVG